MWSTYRYCFVSCTLNTIPCASSHDHIYKPFLSPISEVILYFSSMYRGQYFIWKLLFLHVNGYHITLLSLFLFTLLNPQDFLMALPNEVFFSCSCENNHQKTHLFQFKNKEKGK